VVFYVFLVFSTPVRETARRTDGRGREESLISIQRARPPRVSGPGAITRPPRPATRCISQMSRLKSHCARDVLRTIPSFVRVNVRRVRPDRLTRASGPNNKPASRRGRDVFRRFVSRPPGGGPPSFAYFFVFVDFTRNARRRTARRETNGGIILLLLKANKTNNKNELKSYLYVLANFLIITAVHKAACRKTNTCDAGRRPKRFVSTNRRVPFR